MGIMHRPGNSGVDTSRNASRGLVGKVTWLILIVSADTDLIAVLYNGMARKVYQSMSTLNNRFLKLLEARSQQ